MIIDLFNIKCYVSQYIIVTIVSQLTYNYHIFNGEEKERLLWIKPIFVFAIKYN